jgi:tubulin-specific chaperone D
MSGLEPASRMESNIEDDREVEFMKAAPTIIQDIFAVIQRSLWKPVNIKNGEFKLHRFVRIRDMEILLSKLDIFQENPQLLDVHLQELVSRLSTVYLESLRQPLSIVGSTDTVPLSAAVGKLLYMLCKVRGEKVIVRLLNNEPKYLEPLTLAAEEVSSVSALDGEEDHSIVKQWEERFILLLWLSHLILAPFDLATISTGIPSDSSAHNDSGLELPPNTPSLARRLLLLCTKYLGVATKEQSSAARLLVRICLRPDMRKIGLHGCVIRWTIKRLQDSADSSIESHHSGLGCLQFFNQLVKSGSNEEIGDILIRIYQCCQQILEDEAFQLLKSSAIAQKLIIKISRNISIMSLHSNIVGLEPEVLLSELIDLLLQSLANIDSVVRVSASKSLSIITQQLDAETAEDVINAVLESFTENVLGKGRNANFAAVNPQRWHGLTLTLSHLLYRRAVSPDRLPDVLNSLFLALNFEQRSPTGGSIGTSVRDAANFGIWALARRYRTGELLSVEMKDFQESEAHDLALSVIQILAIELLKSACLDPSGNVRRGSSAALQELIGRHPQTVHNGIALTQTVDYHIVGLLRNSFKAAAQAASLGHMYWFGVLDAYMGWRGIRSNDENTRNLLKGAMFLLSGKPGPVSLSSLLKRFKQRVQDPHFKDKEEWHGIIRMASGVMRQLREAGGKLESAEDVKSFAEHPQYIIPTNAEVYRTRSDISRHLAIAAFDWLYELCETAALSLNAGSNFNSLVDCLDHCLRRFEGDELESTDIWIQREVNDLERNSTGNPISLIASFDIDFKDRAVSWLQEAEQYSGRNRAPGIIIALGATEGLLSELSVNTNQVIEILAKRCSLVVNVDARIVALTAMRYMIQTSDPDRLKPNKEALDHIVGGILVGLRDHTITERGDVGSKVRIAALNTLRALLDRFSLPEHYETSLAVTAIPLALEKLDKVREAAWAIGFRGITLPIWQAIDQHNLTSAKLTETQEYFSDWLDQTKEPLAEPLRRSIVQGFCSSAGSGSESVLKPARDGFIFSAQANQSSEGLAFVTIFICFCRQILQDDLKTDRIVLPVLQTMAYLGDLGYFQQLQDDENIK